jgi:flagellar protein FliS
MIEKEYLANRVANANESQLVALVYEGLIDTIKSAIGYIDEGNKEKLNASVNKVREILAELLATLQGDSEVAINLRSIYVYVNKIVTEAELKGDKGKLEEAIKVINPLYEAWQELGEKDEVATSLSSVDATSTNRPAIVAGMTYGKGQLNDYVINNDDRWQKG